MKNLNLFNKIVYCFNILLALITLVAFVLPFLTPKSFPILSVLTLFLPMFIFVNGLFSLYWILQFKRHFILSALMLILGFPYISRLYNFGDVEVSNHDDSLVLLSYNVRLFNLYQKKKDENMQKPIESFIKNQTPDIICLQEYSKINLDLNNEYPYQHIVLFDKRQRTGHAIFSKFPLLKKGELSLEGNGSSIIFADVIYLKDTIRLYSIHLKSVNITPDVHEIEGDLNKVTQERSKQMLKRMSASFALQQKQAEALKAHRKDLIMPVIICGDLNNSAFSYVYRNVKGDLLDAFEEAGEGFGKSYDFKYYPARIDYIFVDPIFEVKSLKTHNHFIYSDHFPFIAHLKKATE